ncbi:MAG: response regulator transcription factor [Roseivirga sp.]|nr:response regulator transcription factor [Roseivirga sp.]
MTLNCLIIEDQLPAQRILQTYIESMPELKLIGACSNALDATALLRQESIDLIFLDINLPKISGISFLKNLTSPPDIIITTAYPDYALEGFELDVVDYLLKPFSFERFHKAVLKVLGQRSEPKPTDYVFIKSDKEFYKVEVTDILFLKSDDNYVKIITSEKQHMQSGSLQKWTELLSDSFIRVHKSYMINLSKVDKVAGNRVYINPHEIPIGRAYREALLKRISS